MSVEESPGFSRGRGFNTLLIVTSLLKADNTTVMGILDHLFLLGIP